MKEGLPLVIDENTRVLILGSFPSEISLREGEYYSNKSNDFWKIIGNVFDFDFLSISYSAKISKLLGLGIGLWDSYSLCEREGSLDSNIVDFDLNDFGILNELSSNLEKVCFNGKKAGSILNLIENFEYETFILPSSSGANRRNQKKRMDSWRTGLI